MRSSSVDSSGDLASHFHAHHHQPAQQQHSSSEDLSGDLVSHSHAHHHQPAQQQHPHNHGTTTTLLEITHSTHSYNNQHPHNHRRRCHSSSSSRVLAAHNNYLARGLPSDITIWMASSGATDASDLSTSEPGDASVAFHGTTALNISMSQTG